MGLRHRWGDRRATGYATVDRFKWVQTRPFKGICCGKAAKEQTDPGANTGRPRKTALNKPHRPRTRQVVLGRLRANDGSLFYK